MVLTGEALVQSDDKGRIVVPARWRTMLAEGAFLGPGWNNCLFLFPMSQWQEYASRLGAIALTDIEGVAIQRLFGLGTELRMDGQGRIAVPAKLRERAGLNRDVLLCGAINRIEVWNPETRRQYEDRELSDEAAIAKARAAQVL